MENVNEVFDAKVTIRGTLHTLTLIKQLFFERGNERRALGNFPRKKVLKVYKVVFFCDRVFPDKIADRLKKVKGIELLAVTRSPEIWSALFDEDGVRVCLLLVETIVFMGREARYYIPDNLLELVDDLPAWDAYPWGEYFWRAFYNRSVNVITRHKEIVMKKHKKSVGLKRNETYNVYGFVWSLKVPSSKTYWDPFDSPIGEDYFLVMRIENSEVYVVIYIFKMYRNSKYLWNKDPLVIPRGLSWSKVGKFEKEDYGSLFVEWSNPIFSMAPTTSELVQPWFIRSVDYFRSSLVDGQHNLCITASPLVVQQVVADVVEHEPQVVADVVEHEPQLLEQAEPVVEDHVAQVAHGASVLEDQVSPHINNDSDVALEEQPESFPLFTREEILAEHHAIKTSVQLIKSVGDGDPSFVVKELVVVKKRIFAIEKILNFLNDDMSEDSEAKQFVHKELESADAKDNAGFDFDNTDNHSLEDMNEKIEEDIFIDVHVDQTPAKQKSEARDFNRIISWPHPFAQFHVIPMTVFTPMMFLYSFTLKTAAKWTPTGIGGIFWIDCKGRNAKNEVNGHFKEMALYSTELNVVNENEPPSSDKVVRKLLRKRNKVKALVEPYTVLPSTTAPVKKRKSKRLKSTNTPIPF
ncbi:hypothetical protein Tco_0853651 [Tanacetum coccineum]